MKALYLLFSCFFLFLLPIRAQEEAMDHDAKVDMAEAAVNALKTGGLIVRLPTNARKIAGMQEVLARNEITPANYRRLEERITETMIETREQGLTLIRLMREEYEIGPLYFIPDTAYTLIQNEDSAGFFYNDKLELDPSITKPQGDVLLMRIGYADESSAVRAEGFILSNSSLDDLRLPFPGVIAFGNLSLLVNSTLAPAIAERRKLEAAVKRLVRKLGRAVVREKW